MTLRHSSILSVVLVALLGLGPIKVAAADNSGRPNPEGFMFRPSRIPSMRAEAGPAAPTLEIVLRPLEGASLDADFSIVFTHISAADKLFGVRTGSGWTFFCTEQGEAGPRRACFASRSDDGRFDILCKGQSSENRGAMALGGGVIVPLNIVGYPFDFPLGVQLLSVCHRISPLAYHPLAAADLPTAKLVVSLRTRGDGRILAHAEYLSSSNERKTLPDQLVPRPSAGAPPEIEFLGVRLNVNDQAVPATVALPNDAESAAF